MTFSYTEKVLSGRIALDALMVVAYVIWLAVQLEAKSIEQTAFSTAMFILAGVNVLAAFIFEALITFRYRNAIRTDIRDKEILLRANSNTLYLLITYLGVLLLVWVTLFDAVLLIHLMFFGGVAISASHSAMRIRGSRRGVAV